MSEKRINTVVLLFLFIAAGLGFLATLADFGHAYQHLGRSGNPGKGAILCLLDGAINISFSLFMLAFAASYKSKETPESLIDILSFGLFMRLLFVGFLIFHVLPLETGFKGGQFKLQFISFAGVLCSFGQALFMALSVGTMGKDDFEKEWEQSGRDGVISVDAYLTGKTPSDLEAERQAHNNKQEAPSAEVSEKTSTETAETNASDEDTETPEDADENDVVETEVVEKSETSEEERQDEEQLADKKAKKGKKQQRKKKKKRKK